MKIKVPIIVTISEIANALNLSASNCLKASKRHKWKPTGERIQGGGNKYNLEDIKIYKSSSRNEEAKLKVLASLQPPPANIELLVNAITATMSRLDEFINELNKEKHKYAALLYELEGRK